MIVIVGSTALAHFNLNRKHPSDVDIWTDKLYEAKGDIKEIPLEILHMIPTEQSFATPDTIYTIKCSHLGWSNPMWEKHKLDILWLKSNGCRLIPDLYKVLVEYWKKELGDKSFLSLDQSKKDFFTDNVYYKYDHDYLHELVAYPDRPVYEKCLKDGRQVLIDRERFDKLSFDEQVKMFREEISVIACERWLLNDYWNGNISWYRAYHLSLQKTITNLTKNWATDFIVCNLEYFVKPEYSYFENVIKQLGGHIMSKVDLSVFEELLAFEGMEEDLNVDALVLYLCENELSEAVSSNGCENYEVFKRKVKGIEDQFGYEHLDKDGGGEGGSEYCYGVFKLKGKIYKAEYSYYSYNGYEYGDILDTLREVKPVEKTITVYE